MRSLLFALSVSLGFLSFCANAQEDWKTFPYDQSAFDYSGDKLRKAWPQLTRGFGNSYPFPDEEWVLNMVAQHPQILSIPTTNTLSQGTPEALASAYAEKLQDAWRSMFRGDFAQAKQQGMALGFGGQIPAMFSQVIYATFLETDQDEKHRLLEQVIDLTDEAGDLAKLDVVAQFGRIYAKARLGEELSIPVTLKRGYSSQIPDELDAILSKDPLQPYALALYGGYQAGVIRKVGSMVGGLTYGVSTEKMETYFKRSFAVRDDLPIGHYEYANALTYVYGDAEDSKALKHLQQAVTIPPISAMESLEIAHAKTLLATFKKRVAGN
ncbi:hypothetical protein [Pseudomonas sp. M30-35]|uniref:hypothetical protein n=1 Tax=Pseudomonas sp. M30-35 TaxID=1981174 RepID=UPI000B3C3B6C|nr:hypothetical protein [Pseudomonas sp. M30-35]ARU89712.1 hypothetical protein B9K09_17825 [Pseudomonas sp. M30-35]